MSKAEIRAMLNSLVSQGILHGWEPLLVQGEYGGLVRAWRINPAEGPALDLSRPGVESYLGMATLAAKRERRADA